MREMKKALHVGLVALSMTALCWAQTKPAAITDIRIENGDGTILEHATILIQDGKITAVGKDVSIPAEADQISGTGLTAYPGFIDAYTTRGVKLPEAPSGGTPPDSRTTAPASMWHGNKKGIRTDVVAGKCLDLGEQLRLNYRQGILTALVAPGVGTVRGVASVVNYSDKGDVLVPTAGAELAFRGGSGDGYPESLFGIIAELRQYLADSQAYALTPNPKQDPGFENLKPIMNRQAPAIFVADTDREILRAQRISEEFGLELAIASGREAYKRADILKANRTPVFVTIETGDEPSRSGGENNTTPKEVLEERYQNWEARANNVKKLDEAGVIFAFSSTGSSISDYLTNIRALIKRGLPRLSALKAMTMTPAGVLHIDDRVGSISPGKQANLVLMNGDFDKDSSIVKTVFVEGVKADLTGEAGK